MGDELYIIIPVTLVLLFILFILIRTLMFKPITRNKVLIEKVNFDKNKAISSMQELIRCKTISNLDPEKEDYNEFLKFEEKIKDLFPNVNRVCEFHKVSRKGLLYHWKGSNSQKNIVLMSHYDVVIVNEDGWDKDAFSGIVEDGILWGRGTIDTKGTLNGILNAAEHLISNGFTPVNDIYFAFSGEEEVNGTGAKDIIEWFKEHNVKPDFVLDEGGAVVEKVFPGVKEKCAVVGIAEKGMVSVKMEVTTNGGHASTPPRTGAIGMLSKACVNIEKKPFKARLGIPTKALFNTLGRHSTFVYRMIFANLWLFKGLLAKISAKSGGELNALMRTTCALTQMEGSNQINVIPTKASVSANLRLISGETQESAIKYLEKVINNPEIKVERLAGYNPSSISEIDCYQWNTLESVIRANWNNVLVTPYLMVACSDARHYSGFCDNVYRFSAMELSKEERSTIHGNNERIPVETLCKTVEFYIRLMMKF